ncbi:MAG: hypothetical protein U0359_35795 [Byssovorax sp.]
MRPTLAALAASTIATIIIAACGARTGLPVGETPPAKDAGVDVPIDVPVDVPIDVPEDHPPDVHQEDCAEAGITFIYVVTQANELFSFNPPTAAFTKIGDLDCPDDTGSNPFSMGVDRLGNAYVVFSPDGELYKVSTATAACEATSFLANQQGFSTFGMGFATKENGPEEQLYIADSTLQTPSIGIATIDTTTYSLDFIASFSEDLGTGVELTGTGDGRLYGFFVGGGDGEFIAEIDKKTGQISNKTPIMLSPPADFAFAFWGGDFYLFHADLVAGPTTVTRYRPEDGSLVDVAELPTGVVGAGVSTCAPAH